MQIMDGRFVPAELAEERRESLVGMVSRRTPRKMQIMDGRFISRRTRRGAQRAVGWNGFPAELAE